MSTDRTLSADDLSAVMVAFRDALQRHQATINRLNVFPVPDGDTGTNMLLTLESVCSALDDLESGDRQMRSICQAIAKGSLMGARGNSGVILCQVLRAIAEAFSDLEVIAATDLAGALVASSAAARSAVSRPVEGTILTVISGAAKDAVDVAGNGEDLEQVATAAAEGAHRALLSTPSLLAVLAEAHVVDAGGAGLGLLFGALLTVLTGAPIPDDLGLPNDVAGAIAAAELPPPPLMPEGSDGEGPKYEVMYLLDTGDEAIASVRARFDEIGDSTVIVGSEPMFSCHVHTDDIGGAIEVGIAVGRPHDIRVTDLREQVEEERWVREATVGAVTDAPRATPPRTSVVAVASGAGLRKIFASLGAERVVAGGQSMNPSTADILEMTESAPGSDIVLLPNNKNIIPVARQVGALSSKSVHVVETLGVQEGFAALLAYDPAASGEENAELMDAAQRNVVAGEITQAIRDSTCDAGPIAKGDWIGLSREGISSVGSSLTGAATALIEHLLRPEHEIVTLIEGSAMPAEVLSEIETFVEKHHPGISIERHVGGQPLYPLLVAIE